jgi:hypothetical protein
MSLPPGFQMISDTFSYQTAKWLDLFCNKNGEYVAPREPATQTARRLISHRRLISCRRLVVVCLSQIQWENRLQ